MNISINLSLASRKLIGGKTKERSQLCLIATEDGRLISPEADVDRACIRRDELELAFIEDASNQFRDEEDGKWYQILGERSTIPICLIKPSIVENLEPLIDQIYHHSAEGAKVRRYKAAKENTLWSRFTWLVAVVVVTTIVLYVIKVWGA